MREEEGEQRESEGKPQSQVIAPRQTAARAGAQRSRRRRAAVAAGWQLMSRACAIRDRETCITLPCDPHLYM